MQTAGTIHRVGNSHDIRHIRILPVEYAQTISSNQTSVPASSVEITVKAVPALRYDANGSMFIPGKVYCFQDADGKPIIFEDGPQCIFVR